MKILNLYCCLGGNRFKWGDDHEITAVELDPELARMYQERFPNDTVIVADAHQYLLDHYKEFDFIWSSPPCPTHSRLINSMKTKRKMRYPDMNLYQEIILLTEFFTGKWIVENVIPFYEPLIPEKKMARHLYWSNFTITNFVSERDLPNIAYAKTDELLDFHALSHELFHSYKGGQRKEKLPRNLVDYNEGEHILNLAMGIIRKSNVNQTELF